MLPETIGELGRLEELDLSLNAVKILPETLGKLVHLKTLNCYRNQLEMLPEQLLQLTQLRTLNVARNRLEWLPEALVELTNLEMIDVSYNQLRLLSVEQADYLKQRSVLLAGNPFDAKSPKLSRASTCEPTPADMIKRSPSARMTDPLPRSSSLHSFVITAPSHTKVMQTDDEQTLRKPPSLVELAARTIVQNKIPVPPSVLPDHLAQMLCLKGGHCDICEGVFVNEFHSHLRIEPHYMGHQSLPQCARVCSTTCLDVCQMATSAQGECEQQCALMKKMEKVQAKLMKKAEQMTTKSMWRWQDRLQHFSASTPDLTRLSDW
jgi:Leucine-rich repeat (LRR) protein